MESSMESMESSADKKWWHGKVAYQIYPRSFMDGNGDGVGDLRGIISRLDYIQSLGVDILWLSPIFRSPGVDNGYDISDYRQIDPLFGTMDDFDELVAGLRERGIKLILDLVVNHCSSEHPLFRQALENPDSEAAGYFYFVKGSKDMPPDNLRAYFGGSVWEKVPGRENLYYLHYFAPQQPDLNWNNPVVRDKVYDMVNWWLDRGVAGFRIDAIMNIGKDPSFPGLPPDNGGDGMCAAAEMTARMTGRTAELLREMQQRVFAPRRAFTVGEAFGLNPEVVKEIYGPQGCFDTVFDFTLREMMENGGGGYCAFPETSIDLYRRGTFKGQLAAQKTGFAAPILENHDEARAVSVFLPPHLKNATGAKALATVFLFLRGLPFIYQGQEIGLTNTSFAHIGEFQDLQDHNEYIRCLSRGMSEAEALRVLNLHGRDHARTPIPWNSSANGGFSTAKPWIRLHQDYATLNVEAQERDPHSVLNHYRRLIALRRDPRYAECVTYGRFEPLDLGVSQTVAYRRVTDGMTLNVYANFTEREHKIPGVTGEILVSHAGAGISADCLHLAAGDAAVVVTRS